MNHYTQLSLKERLSLFNLMDRQYSISNIAKRMKRHRSTLYRELARNCPERRYCPGIAHQISRSRRRTRTLKIRKNESLRQYIKRHLRCGWSPEQIAGRMKLKHKPYYACSETIYRYIYRCKNKQMYRYLPNHKPRRGKRLGRKVGSGKYHDIPLIHERDESINERGCVGHWEGDSVCFKRSRHQGVSTWVERKTRFVRLRKHVNRKTQTVMSDLSQLIRHGPKKLWRSVCLDQGSEFADYRKIHRKTDCKIYYCEPHSPWQRGSNENFNGRLRRYLPRDTKIQEITQQHLDNLEKKLNNLPRKCLGFLTPKEALSRVCPTYCRTSM